MKKIYTIILFPCVVLYACTNYPEEVDLPEKEGSMPAKVSTRSDGQTAMQFDTLPNPYALRVMQAVYDSLLVAKQLQPTDLYVRFLPQDSLQLNALMYDYNLELFDYPLDLDIGEDQVYVDPTIPEGDFTWLYTTVKPDFVFPEGISYEILEQCYIPADDETITPTRGDPINVEQAAFERLGYTVEPDTTSQTRALWERPKGVINVYDDEIDVYVPVKGVKIRCHVVVKWSTTFTNERGEYSMDSKFMIGPHYAIVFDNRKGFDIWGNWGPFARANFQMGWHSKKGHSRNIFKGSRAWEWAAVNNAGYDYYKMCEQTGIPKPPANLKMWVFKGWSASSAAMSRRIYHSFGYGGDSAWKQFYINMGCELAEIALSSALRALVPDITIGTKDAGYRSIHNVVNHEMAHASHFRTVGSAYWARYITYIITYGAYGDGTGTDAQLCGIGEMWGYAMGKIEEYEVYNPSALKKVYPEPELTCGWLAPHVIWDLYGRGILTKKQIYDCLTPDVDTYNSLAATMYEYYPEKAKDIEAVLATYGIILDTPKPDVSYNDCNVTTDYLVFGNNIFSRNVIVTNGAKLTLCGLSSVTLFAPFTVDKGAQLEIRFQ